VESEIEEDEEFPYISNPRRRSIQGAIATQEVGFIDYQDGPSPSLREMGMNVDCKVWIWKLLMSSYK
jgi:hypothetical protein